MALKQFELGWLASYFNHRLLFLTAGGKGIEPVIQEEITHFIKELEQNEGRPFDLENLLIQATSNIITKVIFGDRFDYSDEKLSHVQFTRFAGLQMLARWLPLLKVRIRRYCFLNRMFQGKNPIITLEIYFWCSEQRLANKSEPIHIRRLPKNQLPIRQLPIRSLPKG